jgi:Raf kinase inhibitor-like YbhB/YbcL family protein
VTRRSPFPVLAIALLVVWAGLAAGCGPSTQDKGGSMLTISSPAFETGGLIPAEHATTAVPGGANTSIPYEWRNAPQGTKSYALVLIDRAPVARNWVHWIVYDIPASSTALPAGASSSRLPQGARELKNTFGQVGYGGPQPPPGTGKHPYEATLYALDVETLSLAPSSATLDGLEEAMRGHILGTASMTGNFGR